MAKSVHSESYRAFLRLLIESRQLVGVSQIELAKRLKKTQPMISKIEQGERRIDIAEFFEIAGVLGIDPIAFFKKLATMLRDSNDKP